MRVFILPSIFLLAEDAVACFKVPSIYSRPYAQVIKESDLIFLGKVKKVSKLNSSNGNPETLKDLIGLASLPFKGEVQYEFDVVDVIKGSLDATTIFIDGVAIQEDVFMDYSDHTDYRFWLDNGGRTRVSPDCSLWPSFQQGSTYLVIKGDKDSNKAYEEIRINGDAWLREVKLQIKITGDNK